MTRNRRLVRVPENRKHCLRRVGGVDVDKSGVLAVVQARLNLKCCHCELRCKTGQNIPHTHTHIPGGQIHGVTCVLLVLQVCVCYNKCTSSRTHTHTHSHSHTHTHTLHTHTLSYTNTDAHTQKHTRAHTITHTQEHTHTHRNTHWNTHTHKHTHLPEVILVPLLQATAVLVRDFTMHALRSL
jgi:hypothetical protein